MLPPRRPGNCVAPQHWLRTQGQEPLLLTLMAALCLRGDSCQHRIEGISFSRWFHRLHRNILTPVSESS
jgi:hypothetical protein